MVKLFVILIVAVVGAFGVLIFLKSRDKKKKDDIHRVTTIIHDLNPPVLDVTRGGVTDAYTIAKQTGISPNLPYTLDPKVNYYENRPAKVYYYPSNRIPQVLLESYSPIDQARIRHEENIYGKPSWPLTSNIWEEMGFNRSWIGNPKYPSHPNFNLANDMIPGTHWVTQ